MKDKFPLFFRKYNSKDIVYFDMASCSLVPEKVMDKLVDFTFNSNAKPSGGGHFISEEAISEVELVRNAVMNFINAETNSKLFFTPNATHAFKQIAEYFASQIINENDIILISPLEHNSNYLPWLKLADSKGAKVQFCKLDENNCIDIDSIPFDDPHLKLISVTHVSHVTGEIQDVKEVITRAKVKNIPVIVDGAQAAAHIPIDVRELGASFYVFSGYKMYGMPGCGLCYASSEATNLMLDFNNESGGSENSERDASVEECSFQQSNCLWELGMLNTPNIVSMSAAINFIDSYNINHLSQEKKDIINALFKGLSQIKDIQLFSRPDNNVGIISFQHQHIHSYDISIFLSNHGICVKAGDLSSTPFMQHVQKNIVKENMLVSVSIGCFNTLSDVDSLLEAINSL